MVPPLALAAINEVNNPLTPHKKNVHYLYIDEFANAYFGFNGRGLTEIIAAPGAVGTVEFHHPTIPMPFTATSLTGGTIFCRQVVALAGVATHSDRRMKKNIEPLTTADLSGALFGIQAYSYNYSFKAADPRTQWGFMAQNVAEYFPHIVQTFDGEMLSMVYEGFIPILWKINQDQQTKIDEQQKRIEELEERIRRIELALQKLEK